MAFSDIFNEIFSISLNNSLALMKERIKMSIRTEVKWIGSYLAKKLMAILLISFSILLFAFASIYALKDYAGFSNTLSFLLLGVILLVGGMILYSRIERGEKHG